MTSIAKFTALMALGAAALVLPAQARETCLQSNRIDHTTVVNPQTIQFKMKDGKVYSSHLRTPCIGLKFNGFAYVTSFDEICGGSQSIRVLNTEQVCVLGPFTPAHS